MTYRIALALALVFSCFASAYADVKLASVFTDNMVLQRDQPIRVWGSSEPNAKIDVSLGGNEASTTASAEGIWQATFEPLRANAAPQKLTASSGESTATLSNVLVGDVWLFSGQSNMAMTLGSSQNGKEFAEKHGRNPLLRLLFVKKTFAGKPQSKIDGMWAEATPERAMDFSAVGFSFGASLAQGKEFSKIPVGLIDASFGATVIEGWIPQEELAKFEKKDIGFSMFGGPTQHYNGMIAPLFPLSIKGAVWYQGESNAGRPTTYAPFMKTLIASWRSGFQQPKLPFFIIQLPAYREKSGPNFFTELREQEAIVAKEDPRVGLVVTYDTHDGSDLHPVEKIPIGARAARQARALVYGLKGPTGGPTFKSVKFDGQDARVSFETANGGLKTSDSGQSVKGFMLAGEDGAFRFATGKIDKNAVVVRADGVESPKWVRYAWAGVPDANLTNEAGLPAVPFRTDDLSTPALEIMTESVARKIEGEKYEVTINGRGSVVSLFVAREQFVANGFGMNGGTNIRGLFGPRSLLPKAQTSLSEITHSDSETSVAFSFAKDSMSWTISNHTRGGIVFEMALADGVQVSEGPPRTLTRGKAKLTIDGFDSVQKQGSETLSARVAVPAGGSKTVTLTPVK